MHDDYIYLPNSAPTICSDIGFIYYVDNIFSQHYIDVQNVGDLQQINNNYVLLGKLIFFYY